MSAVLQNTLYLTKHGSYVRRDHLTLQLEIPDETDKDSVKKVSIPVHHLESICVFGISTISAPALQLCWEHGVAVHYLTEWGQLQARLSGVPDSSVLLRRTQYRAADSTEKCVAIARCMIAGKLHNSRNSLLRAAREASLPEDLDLLSEAVEALARQIRDLPSLPDLPALRGAEGNGARIYFSVFSRTLKQQRNDFTFTVRTRRPALDNLNCLLSLIYALVRNDCITALTAAGLDPFVGFLHTDRANRPSLALDLMEEFRPWLADRLAITLINRQQLGPEHFESREGGAVEFTKVGRKLVIQAYQQRKQETLLHPYLNQNLHVGKLPFIQARILARHLRGDIPEYIPVIPR